MLDYFREGLKKKVNIWSLINLDPPPPSKGVWSSYGDFSYHNMASVYHHKGLAPPPSKEKFGQGIF